MSGRTYRVTGINLKGIPLGEADRIVTILTREQGLIRAVAKGSRKQPSKLGGRMEPFVINDLLMVRGRWSAQTETSQRLQRIVQAETLQTFPRLSRSLAHLTAAQYLAEVALLLALPDQAQEELFVVLVEHLERIERAASERAVLPLLTHGCITSWRWQGLPLRCRLVTSVKRSWSAAFFSAPNGVAWSVIPAGWPSGPARLPGSQPLPCVPWDPCPAPHCLCRRIRCLWLLGWRQNVCCGVFWSIIQIEKSVPPSYWPVATLFPPQTARDPQLFLRDIPKNGHRSEKVVKVCIKSGPIAAK
jgi:DNA replication and repair protein RecO